MNIETKPMTEAEALYAVKSNAHLVGPEWANLPVKDIGTRAQRATRDLRHPEHARVEEAAAILYRNGYYL